MRKIVFSFVGLLIASVAGAQIIPNGYYRVKNTDTERYATVVDDYGKVDYNSTSADVGAIWTYKKNDNAEWNNTRIISNPGSIIYAEGNSSNEYRLKCQGADTYNMVGAYLTVNKLSTGNYTLYASKSGMVKYLFDMTRAGRDSSECVVNASNYKAGSLKWDVYPVEADGDNYFGMYPTLQKGDDYYLSFYAGFPFSFHSQGMKAYYISQVDKELKVAVWTEITGEIPASMPIIAKCASQDPSSNRLDIHNNSATSPSDNMLKGVYFCRVERQGTTNPHHDCVANDPQTMRVLGMLSDGSLGMKVYGGTYIPKNTAYLQVEAGTPEELKLVTPEEYQQMKGVPAQIISLNYTSANMTAAQTMQLVATVLPENATEKTVSWTSSNSSVATVDNTGLVTAIAAGEAIISATTQDGTSLTASCTITVKKEEPPVTKLLGDANGDGKVDVSDITTIASYILGNHPEGFCFDNADANEDGKIDVADITTTASIILGTNVKRGDANGDGKIDVADITTIASYILGNIPPTFNEKNADANNDGKIDVADVTTTAGIILKVKTVKKVVRECIESVKKAKKDIVIPAEYEAIW